MITFPKVAIGLKIVYYIYNKNRYNQFLKLYTDKGYNFKLIKNKIVFFKNGSGFNFNLSDI